MFHINAYIHTDSLILCGHVNSVQVTSLLTQRQFESKIGKYIAELEWSINTYKILKKINLIFVISPKICLWGVPLAAFSFLVTLNVTSYFHSTYPQLHPDQSSSLRAALHNCEAWDTADHRVNIKI